jgi:hypothetical protein
MVSTALVINYLVAGPCIGVFRRLCPELPRPIKVPGGDFFGVAGFVCALLLVYFAGWVTLINVATIVLLGLPVYAAYASARAGWSPRVPSSVLAVVFAVVWMVVNVDAGWLGAATTASRKHWPIAVYTAVFVLLVIAFLAVLWSISNAEGRKHLRSGVWILPAVLATTFLSYFGDNGPQKVFTYGSDLVIVILIAIGTYYWAVREGFRTPELEQAIYNTLNETEDEEPETAPA